MEIDMTIKPSQKRPQAAGAASGAKMLVTAASLAALVGGWAGFTIQKSTEIETAQENGIEQASQNEMQSASLVLPPLPTLIPEPGAAPSANLPTPSPLVLKPVPTIGIPPNAQSEKPPSRGSIGRTQTS